MVLLRWISFDLCSTGKWLQFNLMLEEPVAKCAATQNDLKDRELVVDGFPINRTISDAIRLFGEFEDIASFFALQFNPSPHLYC